MITTLQPKFRITCNLAKLPLLPYVLEFVCKLHNPLQGKLQKNQ